jgi:hypothetical protein
VTAKYKIISQLCSTVALGDCCNSYVLDDLCNKFWQNTYLRHFILTWVQNGRVGLEKNMPHVKNNVCAEW